MSESTNYWGPLNGENGLLICHLSQAAAYLPAIVSLTMGLGFLINMISALLNRGAYCMYLGASLPMHEWLYLSTQAPSTVKSLLIYMKLLQLLV